MEINKDQPRLKSGNLIAIFLIILLISIPSFARMLKFGIFSMHDFHVFRLFEFDNCVKDKIFPCRWAKDSGFGYGEPVFSFYPQLSYFLAEPFVLSGLSIVNSTKIAFIISLFGSGISMFFLAKYLWKDSLSAILSSTLYVNAPYRAVDVWVRGALPESMAFVFYPLCILFFERYMEKKNRKYQVLLGLSLGLLVLTHNLSFLMFGLFFSVWVIYRLWSKKLISLLPNIGISCAIALLLAAFQLIPIVTEMKYIQIQKTLEGYYDYRAHFATIKQLLISSHWGYGASLWGPVDDLSLSVGPFQWILAGAVVLIAVRKKSPLWQQITLTTAVGIISLFLAHNKSTFIWQTFPILARLQFPWRWLSIATFSFALAGGAISNLTKNKSLVIIIALGVIIWNFQFQKPDIWYQISDEDQFKGGRWDEQRASAVNDFWPKYGKATPISFAPTNLEFSSGSGSVGDFSVNSHSAAATLILKEPSTIVFPIVYFPGWVANSDQKPADVLPESQLGRITLMLSSGKHDINLVFKDTYSRRIGNLITVTTLLYSLVVLLKKDKYEI